MNPNEKGTAGKVRSGYNSYLRFTGLGFTMIGIILLFCFVLYNWMQSLGQAEKEGAGHA